MSKKSTAETAGLARGIRLFARHAGQCIPLSMVPSGPGPVCVGRRKRTDPRQGPLYGDQPVLAFAPYADTRIPRWCWPDNDTLYSISVLDLTEEPVILSVPDVGDRYYSHAIGSVSADNFGYVGKRTSGTGAGHYAIIGPDWQGEWPEAVHSVAPSQGVVSIGESCDPFVRSPTNTAFILGRTVLHGAGNLAACHAAQDG